MIRHSTHLPSASPLASSRLDVTIDDLIAHYELRHRFRNDRAEPIEIVYSFPLPLDAAFLGMEATLAGDTRVARVQPRHSAREAFDDAIAEGDSAVLLERLEPGLLCVDLGNLKPGEDGEIVLRFTAALAVADGIARFSLPLVHRPRYGRSRLDELATPTYDFAVEHPLDATIRVTGRLADTPVQCASHAVRFAREGDALRLTLGGALLDRDLVLNFDLPENLASLRLVADEAGAIGLVDLTAPRQQHADAPMDVCLVLDDSGSMIGDAVAQSRNALTAMADALGDEDRVQVLRFGSSVVPLFRRPLRATQRVRDAMHALARTVGANLGGTEMSEALSAALDALTDADSVRSRAIILVTDGAVQPHELTAARDAAMARGIRIFVVAVGSSAGADVLEPLARATGAVLERAVPAEPIDAAVLRQFRRARCIAPLEIQLNWGDGARPLPPSPIYPGDAATLVAFLPDAAPRRVQVRIGPAETASVLSCDHATTDPARRAWAGQQAYAHAESNTAEREAIALRYGLIAEETSAVLVKVRADGDRVEGLPTIVPVAHMLPHGMLAAPIPAPMPTMAKAMDPRVAYRKVQPSPGSGFLDIPCFLRKTADPAPEATPAAVFKDDTYECVLEDAFDEVPPDHPLSPARCEAARLELRRALEALLLGPGAARFTPDALLAALDPALRDDVEAWLASEGILLDDASAAADVLLDLADDGIGAPLTDDQEAALAVLLHGAS